MPTNKNLSQNLHNGISQKMKTLNDLNYGYLKKVQKKRQLNFANARVMDVGIGGGFLAKKIIQANHSVSYTGVDIDNYLIQAVKGKVKFIKADLNHSKDIDSLLKTKNKYDYIFIFDVLEHLIHFHYLLQNIHQVLSQGGLVIISVPIDINLSTKIKMLFRDSAFSSPFTGTYGHINLFSFHQLMAGLTSLDTLKVVAVDKRGLGYGLHDKSLHLDILAAFSPLFCGRVYVQLKHRRS